MVERRIQDFATAEDALGDDLLLVFSEGETYNMRVKTLKEAVQGDADRAEAAAEKATELAAEAVSSAREARTLFDAVTLKAQDAAQDAAASASAAAESQAAAKFSENASAGSASAAAQSESNAASAASAAADSQTAAANSEAASESSAENALASQQAAKASADNAGAQAEAAAGSAEKAATSESNAKESETKSKASEEAAAKSEAAAKASKEAAEKSKSASADSADKAKAEADRAAQITTNTFIYAYDLTLSPSGWAECSDEAATAAGLAYQYDAALADCTDRLEPSATVAMVSIPAAQKAGLGAVCESRAGAVRFWAAKLPEAEISLRLLLTNRTGEEAS